MRKLSKSQRNIITIDFIIFLFCLVGIYNIINKSDLPFQLNTHNSNLIISDTKDYSLSIKNGDILKSVDNLLIKSKEEVEVYLDGKAPGKKIKVEVEHNDYKSSEEVILKPFYNLPYVIIACLVGLLFFIVAVIVLIKCESIKIRNSFHWAFIFTGMIILLTWGNHSILPFGLSYATRIGFHIGYIFAPIFFLKFSFEFTSQIKFNKTKTLSMLSIIGLLLVLFLSVTFLMTTKNPSLKDIKNYILVFDISSIFIVLVIFSAIGIFVYSYTTTSSETERKKIRWIIIGFFLGPISYLLLWVIPFRIWNQPVIPESAVLLLIAFVPITFGISIIKYRLMNVDIIFRRGIVYTSVISFLLLIYLMLISLFTYLLNITNKQIPSLFAAISIALLFQPLKEKVQKFVNRKFFRIKYDYRLALKLFNREIQDLQNKKELTEKAVDFIDQQIPVKKIGFFYYDSDTKTIELKAHKNLENFQNGKISVISNNDILLNNSAIACSNNFAPEINIIRAFPKEFKNIKADLILNVKSSKFISHGFLILTEKMSDTNFTAEDIDLLNTISSRLSLTLDRIKLQEEVIKEHLESERLEELNKLKTYFVSSVSHDLKTPLTSIKLFAERLKSSQDISLEKKNSYLEIIEGESDRLTRLINNVLDFSKIERGTQQYKFIPTNLVEIVKKVLIIMEYQFRMNKFDVKVKYEANNIMANIDADAVSEALINLFSNAIKYYSNNRVINVLVRSNDEYAVIDIEDKGKGIEAEDLTNIFDPFFRSNNLQIDKAGGAGLGLAIVKHIMDAHKGVINIKSKVNVGTKVNLEFPLK